ncbi:hypothetical protein CBS147482_1127 [Aspergillus niger]|nr:hypothetical protein CBS147482_1127 [Aspergillus niger]
MIRATSRPFWERRHLLRLSSSSDLSWALPDRSRHNLYTERPPVQPHFGDLGYYHFQCCWTGQNATDEGPLAAPLRIVGNDCGQPSTNGCIFSLPVHCRSPRHFAGYRSLALHHVRHVEISMYRSCLI